MSNWAPEYEGKAKQLIPTDDTDVLIQRFKNSATAFNGEKKAEFEGKGDLNNAMSCELFSRLEAAGVPTHYLGKQNHHDMLVKRLSIIPLEVVVRNYVAGSLGRRTGLEDGTKCESTIVETYYKRDDLGDPILADTHVLMLGLASEKELEALKSAALKVNDVLVPIFEEGGLRLVDFKLEFGVDVTGALLLGDEISPDTCRIWDIKTNQKLDKDVFRQDLGDLMEAYRVVITRLSIDLD